MHYQFNSYRIYYQSSPNYHWQSRVYLYNDNRFVGSVYFMKEGEHIPNNTMESGAPRLYFPALRFDEMINMFRQESPLYISLAPENGIGTISTTDEPILVESND